MDLDLGNAKGEGEDAPAEGDEDGDGGWEMEDLELPADVSEPLDVCLCQLSYIRLLSSTVWRDGTLPLVRKSHVL